MLAYNALLLAGMFTALFAAVELAYRIGVPAEYTRKTAHTGAGLLALLFPVWLPDPAYVGLLSGGFALILVASKKLSFLPSIHAVPRKTQGAVLFPVAVLCCFCLSEFAGDRAFYYVPVLLLALCDPLACWAGKRWPLGRFHFGRIRKSLLGSTAFLALAIAIVWYFIPDFNRALLIALAATVSEALTGNGWDNFTIPLTTVASIALLDAA